MTPKKSGKFLERVKCKKQWSLTLGYSWVSGYLHANLEPEAAKVLTEACFSHEEG